MSPVPGGGPRHLSDSFLSLETNYPGGVDKQGPSGLVSLRPGLEEAPLGRRVQGPEVQRKPGQAPRPQVDSHLSLPVRAGLPLCVGDSPADAYSSRGLGCIRQTAPRGSSSTCSRGGRHTPVLAPSTSPWLPQLSCGLGFASLGTATAAPPPCCSLPVNVGFWKFLPPSSSTEARMPRAFPFTPRKLQVGWGSEGQRICLCVLLKEENLGPRYPVPTQLQRAIGGQGSS